MPEVDIIEVPSEPRPAEPAASGPRPTELFVATPCYGGRLNVKYLASMLGLRNLCAQRGIAMHAKLLSNESLVERARSLLVAHFLDTTATHLLFIDADIGFPPEAVFKLLEADKDIVTGVYAKKMHNWQDVKRKLEAGDAEPVQQMGLDFNINIMGTSATVQNGLLKVLDAATGFMLLRRSAVQSLVDRYRQELECVNDISSDGTPTYVAVFACMIDPQTKRFLSEDYSLCRRWQAMGGDVWADVSFPLCHMGTRQFGGDIRQRFAFVGA